VNNIGGREKAIPSKGFGEGGASPPLKIKEKGNGGWKSWKLLSARVKLVAQKRKKRVPIQRKKGGPSRTNIVEKLIRKWGDGG